MRDYLFTVNKENAFDLQKKFNLNDFDTDYLYRNFWPIIVLTDISTNEFQNLLLKEKKAFISKRKKFVFKIFKRDYLDYLIYELNNYLDNINKGKTKVYDKIDETYFHWFKLKLDIKSYTLLLSKKDITDLEIYFIDLLNIIEVFISENETLPPQQTEKPKSEQEAPQTFDELFYNIELVQPSIDILKEIEPPLIDTDYNYIGKLKGIICVWIDELQRQGIVKHYSDRKIFASLIPQKIKRFSIDESMFGKYQSKAENNYRTDIKTKVSKIKLSQNSH
ncbi:MAG: hypothetical protein HKP48_09745 [Winogradskyella sp.]|uniref:hypothetical protein n=1 Tax=Winogradskyella sp. TaxID=1883156 RepID=UPI0017BD789B|nr:hypothetical protein [Winogradskyella sp.]MBT8245643.1 hypothetical protein [Winogradskyella sp.]NNK23550.1 hypothetical protein [Winogradskyella sp.]